MTEIYCDVEECKWNDEARCGREITRVAANAPRATVTEVVNCMSFSLPEEEEEKLGKA